jgi:predicted transcriptional regulator
MHPAVNEGVQTMARPSSRHPTELELEILKILWRQGPLPVSKVRDALAGFRDLAITSVTTIMNIMVRKGYLTRQRSTGSYAYRPRISERATGRRMLRDMVDRVFDGSAAVVMARLLETADLDERELNEIRALLNRQGGGKP